MTSHDLDQIGPPAHLTGGQHLRPPPCPITLPSSVGVGVPFQGLRPQGQLPALVAVGRTSHHGHSPLYTGLLFRRLETIPGQPGFDGVRVHANCCWKIGEKGWGCAGRQHS